MKKIKSALWILIVIVPVGVRWMNDFRFKDYIPSSKNVKETLPASFLSHVTDIEGVQVEIVEEGKVNGFHLIPKKLSSKGVVVTFGGSEGSSNYDVALMLARNGYEVYSLFFFGYGKLPKELKEVPLNFFEDFLDFHERHSQSKEPITVLGASKGAELALNLASRYEEISHIVLYSPSAYSFFSLNQKSTNQSSWINHQKVVPYLSVRNGSMMGVIKMMISYIFNFPIQYYPVFQSVIENTPKTHLETARIKVEKYAGDGLVFVGGDDLMWPSELMTKEIKRHAQDLEVYTYPNAGHSYMSGRYIWTPAPGALIALGGDKYKNSKANESSNRILRRKLKIWHA